MNIKVGTLSGTTRVGEVPIDMLTAIVSSCNDMDTATFIQDVFMKTCIRVYTNTICKELNCAVP